MSVPLTILMAAIIVGILIACRYDDDRHIILRLFVGVLVGVGMIILCYAASKENQMQAIAPEVNTEGLCIVEIAETAITEPVYELYFTEADVIAMAQMLYGEARGCELTNQQQAVWCVLNRVDDERFPDTIIDVLSQPYQFHGYSQSFPVWENLVEIARDVMTRWSYEKQGADVERELDKSAVWFSGDGFQNWFRSDY